MTRVGAVDIGTNSTRLLIADVVDGRLADVDRRSVVTGLGEGVDRDRELRPAAIARVHAVLVGYREALDEHAVTHTLAVATSAVRDAANGAAFLTEIGERFGFATRLLSGDEEARLTREGVGATAATTLLLDVGGGSTELIVGEWRRSLDIGSVRLTERFLHGDPPSAAELERAAAYVASLLPELDVTDAVGVAGTVTQLHALAGELTVDTVAAELDRLSSLTLAERRTLPGMDPARAPVILGGAIVVLEVLRRYGLAGLAWSLRDLLDGVALEAAALP